MHLRDCKNASEAHFFRECLTAGGEGVGSRVQTPDAVGQESRQEVLLLAWTGRAHVRPVALGTGYAAA